MILRVRCRSQHVAQVKARLLARLHDGVHRPGDRFLSARAVARHFRVSYQTAHRLLQELGSEGLLTRVEASGTYLAGGGRRVHTAQLTFAARGRREGSFGDRLRQTLQRELHAQGMPWTLRWRDKDGRVDRGRVPRVSGDVLPVIWDAPDVLRTCITRRRSAVLLNERPSPGLESAFVDSVSVDDFAGGVYAAQLLERRATAGAFAILAGPEHDPRSRARVAGCLSRIRGRVISVGSWYREDGLLLAEAAVSTGPAGIFCANDRLAEAVHHWCAAVGRQCPPLVGFDDAPVAEAIGLTTIAIPWEEVASVTAALIRRRLGNDSAAARHVVLSPRPVVRR